MICNASWRRPISIRKKSWKFCWDLRSTSNVSPLRKVLRKEADTSEIKPYKSFKENYSKRLNCSWQKNFPGLVVWGQWRIQGDEIMEEFLLKYENYGFHYCYDLEDWISRKVVVKNWNYFWKQNFGLRGWS